MKLLVPSLRLSEARSELDLLVQREGGISYRPGPPEMRTRTLLGRSFPLGHTPIEFTGAKPSQRFLNEVHQADLESLEGAWPTDLVLAAALAVIRDEGLFRSRHRAAQEDQAATSDLMLMVLEGSLALPLPFEDAEEIVGYSQELHPETTFQQTMQRELRYPLLPDRRLGLAAAAAWDWLRKVEGLDSLPRASLTPLQAVRARLKEQGSSASGLVNRYKWEDREGNTYTWFSCRSLGLAQGEWALLTGTVASRQEAGGKVETRLKNAKVD